jgi:hypothetical protein
VDKYGVKVVQAKDFPSGGGRELRALLAQHIIPAAGGGGGDSDGNHNDSDVYISCDLDCLDPAFAPGVAHREPGGLSTRQLLDTIHAIPGRVRCDGFAGAGAAQWWVLCSGGGCGAVVVGAL